MRSSRLEMLIDAVSSGSRDALPRFWAEVRRDGSPIVEPSSADEAAVTFVWRDDGRARSVAVIQDWGADGIREHQMLRLPGTDVWHLTRLMRLDTRTTYQLSPSPSEDPMAPAPYQPDPLNPNIHVASLPGDPHKIVFSLLELPAAPPLPWRSHITMGGAVEAYRSDGERQMWTYTPRTPARSSLVVFAGQVYKDLLRLPQILDYLIEHERIRPVAALMIDSPDRSELLCDPSFSSRVANDIVPRFRKISGLGDRAQDCVAAGSSNGGLAAAFTALSHPQVFGAALCQGGWFRWHPSGDREHHWLARQIPRLTGSSVRFWLQVGNLETAEMLDGGPSQLDANKHFRDVLLAHRFDVSYQEYSGGHDTSSLEAPLAQALTEIFGPAD